MFDPLRKGRHDPQAWNLLNSGIREAPVHGFDQWNFFSADISPQDFPFWVECSSCPKELWGLLGLKAEGLSAKLSSTSISHDLGWQVRDDKDSRAWGRT